MEITKDDYLNINYNEKKDSLKTHKNKKENIFKNHKFIATVLGITSILVLINLYLIYKFFEILCTI